MRLNEKRNNKSDFLIRHSPFPMKNLTNKLYSYPELYMKFYWPHLTPERTKVEVDFVDKVLKKYKAKKLLDIPCGFGRHTIQLAKRGYKVEGIDYMDYFIKLAKKDAKESKVKVDFSVWDMSKLNKKSEFDAVLNLFTSFGYFDEETNLTVLKKFAAALKKGWILVIDTINRDRILDSYRTGSRKAYDRIKNDVMMEEESYDPLTGYLTNNRSFIINGKVIESPYSLRVYTYTELATLLSVAGFKILESYGDYEWGQYSLNSRRMIIVAKKL